MPLGTETLNGGLMGKEQGQGRLIPHVVGS